MIKVFMTPSPNRVDGSNGIHQVVLNYAKYLPQFGFEFTDNLSEAELVVNHAGVGEIVQGLPFVASLHGLYWNHPDLQLWQHKANRNVITAIHNADEITVPSDWVAETFRRDMRLNPHVIGHGINAGEWKPQKHDGYVLWNKNRKGDVCYVEPIGKLARIFPQVLFASTFATDDATPNINEIGTMPHSEMKEWVQKSMVYLSTTKETFGIGILEAMASGVPVLGFDYGGNSEIIQHGVTGYLAEPDNYDDLANGLDYCIQYRDALGENAIEVAKQYTWESVCEKVAQVYTLALNQQDETVSIVIPVFNKQDHEIERAIRSASEQDYDKLEKIVVVDDGSKDGEKVAEICHSWQEKDNRIEFIQQNNQGVAYARNNGIARTDTKYIMCLDGDDELYPYALSSLVPYFDRSLGVVYGSLDVRMSDDSKRKSGWPSECDFDLQIQGKNQVPTCCVFRREMWERLGGYKQRYAPTGCGAEDAEFWLRAGAYGYGMKKVSTDSTFIYSIGGLTMKDGYEEVDWTYWHPWTNDELHPFASIATPERFAHPVRQYDTPFVSVIIPIGPGHEKDVYNALDSLEAQTFRNWEAIVVWDCEIDSEYQSYFNNAYPYVKQTFTHYTKPFENKGAGYARNRGVDKSRSPFVVFLDADDWLYPDFLNECVKAWNETESIIYTDYVGKAIISQEHANTLGDRLKAFDPQTGHAIIAHRSAKYDCELAQRQPQYTGDANMPFYHWCIVNCFIPKSWHYEIGGFDENMPTWEDLDYHWRMAHLGKCYTHIEKELVVYNFYSGHRRANSQNEKTFKAIVEYLNEKYEGTEKVMCKSCASKLRSPLAGTFGMYETSMASRINAREKDDNFVWATYIGRPNNRSDHPIVGTATGQRYAYGHYGQRVLVHKMDIFDNQGRHYGPFEIIKEKPAPAIPDVRNVQRKKQTVKPPTSLKPKKASFDDLRNMASDELITSETVDLQTIPGVTNGIAKQLVDRDILTVDAILDFGVEGLVTLKYCDEIKADLIISAVQERYAS